MSAITFGWYINLGKASFLIKMMLPQYFALEVWVSIFQFRSCEQIFFKQNTFLE